MNLKSIGMLCTALAFSFCMMTSSFSAPANDTAQTDPAQNKTKYEHRHNYKKSGERPEFCENKDCKEKGIHEHNGKKYVGKHDKHEGKKPRYERCTKDDCTEKGVHEHNDKKFVGKYDKKEGPRCKRGDGPRIQKNQDNQNKSK